jgi:hypothetical protein
MGNLLDSRSIFRARQSLVGANINALRCRKGG